MRLELEIPDEVLYQLLDPVPLPRVARARLAMPTPPPLPDVSAALEDEVDASGVMSTIGAGQRIAIGVGSRGIDRLDEVVGALVRMLRARDAVPFIVPAMGSHGGATAEGQREVLANLGITAERVGAPIESQMETREVGRAAGGAVVRLDRLALQADGIVFVARVKPHTAFRGPYESGLAKMIAIGLGKQAGAAATHARGFGEMARMVPAMAEVALTNARILFGLAVLENACHRIFKVSVLPADRIMAEEPALLLEAAAAMPRIPFEQLDILVIDEIGKNISGDGADPNVTGRYPTPFATGGPAVDKQVVLDLAAASAGNANGIGTADFTTTRCARKIDLASTYPNALTSTVPGPVKLPMVLPSDRLALAAAVLTCHAVDRPVRLLRIKNTVSLDQLWVSEALLDETAASPTITVESDLTPFPFDDHGNLADLSSSSTRERALERTVGSLR